MTNLFRLSDPIGPPKTSLKVVLNPLFHSRAYEVIKVPPAALELSTIKGSSTDIYNSVVVSSNLIGGNVGAAGIVYTYATPG